MTTRVAYVVLAFAAAAGCGGPRDLLRGDLADPVLPDDSVRSRLYQQSPATMLAAARRALDERGFRVGESHRTARGTWLTAGLGGSAMGANTSQGIGILVRGMPDGSTRVSVVSRASDPPATVHVWIANALSTTAP